MYTGLTPHRQYENVSQHKCLTLPSPATSTLFHLAMSSLSHTHPYVHLSHLKTYHTYRGAAAVAKARRREGAASLPEEKTYPMTWRDKHGWPFVGRHRWGKLYKSVGAQNTEKNILDIWGKRCATYAEKDALESLTSSSPTTYSPRIDAGGQPKRPSFGVRT